MKKEKRNIAVVAGVAMAGIFCHIIGIPACIIRGIFGVPCPGCGCTDALLCLLRGKVLQSLQYNPLVITGVAILPIYLAQSREIEAFIGRHKAACICIAAMIAAVLEIYNLKRFGII